MVITIAAGCWTSRPAPAPITATPVPRAKAPVKPDVTFGDVGIWDADGVFRPTAEIPLHAGTTFGWRIRLPCGPRLVALDEELHLPAPGDWGVDPDMRISADRKSASLRYQVDCRDDWIEKRWSVSEGDPPGVWVIRVTVDGFAPKTFRASFRRDVLAPPAAP